MNLGHTPEPTPPPAPPLADPPPPNWLRAGGLVFLVIMIAADLVDGRLDASDWALVTGLGVALWGPSVVSALARSVRGR